MITVGIGPETRVGKADVLLSEGFAAVNLDAILNRLGERAMPPAQA